MTNLDYLYKPEIAKSSFDKNYFVDKKLGFSVIENGTILPHKDSIVDGKWTWGKGGIINSSGKFIKSSHVLYGIDNHYTPLLESIQYSSETVIYLTIFFPVWGHVITDNINRLWFLKSDVFKSQFKNCPIVYIPYRGIPLDKHQNIIRLLKILGVEVGKIRPITQPTRFDKIILFDRSFGASYFTKEYREMMDIVRNFALKNQTPTSSKKIYYFYGRNQVGEERLAEYFKSKGYEIVLPEKLTLDEQLNILINCESFASTVGSCAHNSVFLHDKTECIFIPRSFNAFTGYQKKIDQVRSLNASYIDSTLSIFNVRHNSFCYIISEQLKKFFGDKWNGYEYDDFKTFLDYVKSPLRRNREATPYQVTGYSSVYSDFMEQLLKCEDLIAAYNLPPGWEQFRPLLTYQTHVAVRGWKDGWKSEDQISNPLDKKRDIQAIKINFSPYKVYYSVYYNEQGGWSEEVLAPDMAGTTGKSKAIMGIKIRLDEAGTKKFDILYRVHKFNDTWTTWAKNGEVIYSHGIKLNAIQIKLEPK